MKHYDPDVAPDPEEWFSLDEQERIQLAEAHHRMARVKLPNVKVHACFHAIVENQIAEGLESVVRASTAEARYNAAVERLTAKEWRRRYGS